MTSDELMTSREVAEQLTVSRSTVVRWARAGLLDVVKLPGRTIRFRRSDVERLLANPPASEVAAS